MKTVVAYLIVAAIGYWFAQLVAQIRRRQRAVDMAKWRMRENIRLAKIQEVEREQGS